MKLLALPFLLVLAAPALAEDAACPRPAIEPGFAAWAAGHAAALAVGTRADLTLKPATEVRFVPRLARAPQPGTFGGWFPITVPSAGTYRFAVSAPAWVDAVSHGKRLKSVAHGHGAACSGIAKIVAFALPAGRAYLQLSEAKAPAIAVMAARQ